MKGLQMENVNPLIEMVDELVEELASCGHEDISSLDLLDALASCGLRLVGADGDESSAAYIEALGVQVAS